MLPFCRALWRALLVVALCHGLSGLKIQFESGVIPILGLGTFCMALFPAQRHRTAILAGVLVWMLRNPLFAVYFTLGLCGIERLWSSRWLWVWLIGHTLFVPKFCFFAFYHHTIIHDWFDSYGLSLLFLGTVYWKVEEARGKVAVPGRDGMAYFLFPTQALNTINFGPLDYLKESYIPAGSILRAAALCAAKSLLLVLAARFAGGWYFSSISASDFKALTHLKLWLVVYFNYATTVLWLSGTADFVVAVARACGIPLDFNYKFALLAWNPVEVWRRWAIYNRKLLLKLIYFPLGGNQRQVYRNIMATFLASAWVLHSGWIGSRYLEVGLEGWRDYSVYFIIQGLAVCGCLFYWKIIRKDSRSDRDLRFSPGRIVATVATQGFNAWVHVLILGQVGWTWGQRWELMGRLCGWS